MNDGASCANCKFFQSNVLINGKNEFYCNKDKKVLTGYQGVCDKYIEFKGYRE